jgi:membrane-bound lytic murein transglycosylase A
MIRPARAAFVSALLAMTPAAAQNAATYTILSFDDLNGWENDDHQAALDVFGLTCGALPEPEWASVCALAADQPNARAFFERYFSPLLIEDGKPGLFTAYYEPELDGSLARTERYRYPLYRKPPEVRSGEAWYSRAEIESGGLLSGQGLEIAWISDPVDVFFLQVQGSGRIRLQNGQTLRIGYGGSNGHAYRSIGKELVRRGTYQAHQVSAKVIRNWMRRNPTEGAALLHTNPSFVFFRLVRGASDDQGPIGAMNRAITAHRTLAIDPSYVPLGAPVWVEKGGNDGFQRLMVAQDTGSAIKGAQRGDIFFGTGHDAGHAAGRVRDPGRMVVLVPIELANAKAGGTGE